MRPSTVAGANGAAVPEKRAHCRPGAKALVVDADHPDVVALTDMVTPADGLKLFISAKLRSEEHTSELQSLAYLVCRLLLEKKNKRDSTGPQLFLLNPQA